MNNEHKKTTALKATVKWTEEDKQLLKSTIINDFYDLINRSEKEGLYWKGATCDLIDMAHMVWESGALLQSDGRPMDFITIVRNICRVLHVLAPRNPSSTIMAVRARKNVRVGPLLDRYLYVMNAAGIQDPMRLEIRRRKPHPRPSPNGTTPPDLP